MEHYDDFSVIVAFLGVLPVVPPISAATAIAVDNTAQIQADVKREAQTLYLSALASDTAQSADTANQIIGQYGITNDQQQLFVRNTLRPPLAWGEKPEHSKVFQSSISGDSG